MSKISPSLVVSLMLGAFALSEEEVCAAFTFNITQSGPNIAISGSGTINTSALILHSTGSASPELFPAQAMVIGGPTSSGPCSFYLGVSGPTRIGAGEFSYSTIGTGDVVGTGLGSTLEVPAGYISGSLLSDYDIIPNETLSYVGLTPGSYVDTWGSGPTADSLTINIGVVPEPASIGLAFAAASIVLLRRRRRLV